MSAEVNYGIRFTCVADAEKFISELAAEVANRLTSVNLKGKCITLKLKVKIYPLFFFLFWISNNFESVILFKSQQISLLYITS